MRAALQQAAILELGDLGLQASSSSSPGGSGNSSSAAAGAGAAGGDVRKWSGLADYIASLGPKQKASAELLCLLLHMSSGLQ